MTGPGSPPLAWTELERLVAAGDVDTVIVAFTDMQGRLAGKRISGRHFVDDIATRGVECCSYLLAVDVDLNTVPGYAMASWDTGYGDMVMTPDLSTLRLIPWLPGTALVIADLVWADGSEVAVSPRSILRRQLDRLKARGLVADVATELEFIVFDQPYRQAWASGYRGLTRPATTTSTTRYWHPRGWSRCCATSGWVWPVRVCDSRRSKANATWASRRSGFVTTRRWSPATTMRSTRTAPRKSPTSTARA
ncbi:glutamine synthetase [Mycobacterium tuberculosis variant microti]|nr:glutamine synthetase [Mycobacterium tuberculosis variant microti]